jgi:gamma-glutamylputrescine oxidase
MKHIDSYYSASTNAAPLSAPLSGDIEADVCVVGGGIAGCATALFLAQRGYKVVLLEGNRIAFGASGRSGGQAKAAEAYHQPALYGYRQTNHNASR